MRSIPNNKSGLGWAFKSLSLSLIALFFLTTSVFAQSNSGDVVGTVADASGAAIQNASVTATNEATSVKVTVVSNAEGSYRFTNLPIGSYTITAAAAGFSPAGLKSIAVDLNKTVTANLTLPVGATSATVEVNAAAAVIDTTTAQLSSTYSTTELVNMPTAATGSGIYNLTLLGAGVSSSGGVGQGFGPSVAGQRPDDNVFTIDGVSNQNHYNPAPLVYVSNESVAELSLLQNQFAPEFSGGSGGIFNTVVKTGTNQIHGSIYEYMQNRNLNALDQLDVVGGLTSLPRYDNNRLGASVGGPILKNKLFYFGNFEYNPIGQSAGSGAIEAPTAAGYSVISGFSSKISANNLSTFQKYVGTAPTATGSVCVFCTNNAAGVPVPNVPVGTITIVNPSFTNNYDAVVSLDYILSDKDQLRGRWIYNKSEGIATAQLPIFNVPSPNNNYFYSLSEFHNFSPTMQNEFRSSFSRNFNQEGVPNITFPGLSVFPVITIDDLNGITLGPSGPSGSIQNLAQFQDNMSIIKGNHTMKFGYHFTDVIATNYFIQRVLGNYEYNNFATYLQDLTPDVLGERSAGPVSDPVGFLENNAFFNDDWKIRKNLTVNLGLNYEYVTMPIASRYQVYSNPANVPGVFTVPEPKYNKNNWAPRVGFAYAPGKSGEWAIRGGFAIAYDESYANLTANAAPPYFQQTNDVQLGVGSNFLASGGLPGNPVPLPTTQAAALGVLSSITYGGKRPYGITYNIGIQKVFHKDYTFEARYVGTRGVHLWTQTRLNINSRVSASNSIPTYFSMPSLSVLASEPKTLGQVKSYIVPGGTSSYPYNSLAAYGSTQNLVGYNPEAYSSYNGLALQLNRRFSNGLTFIGAYTWSHAEDDATATNFSTYLTPRRAQDWQNLSADWAASALDRRQRLTLTPIYEWRPFKSSNWFVKNLVGNWNVSGTYTYQSPEYATVQSGLDSNLNNDSAGDRSIINPSGTANVGTGVTGYNAQGQVATTSASIVAYVANNSNARYVVAGAGALANGGRNTYPLHPTNNIDAALYKRFNFRENMRFSIGAQFYNLFNHAQFTGGYLSDVASNGSTGSRNDLIPNNPDFGRFDKYYSSNPRSIQLNARFDF